MPAPCIYLVNRTNAYWHPELLYAVLALDLAATQYLLEGIATAIRDGAVYRGCERVVPTYHTVWLPPTISEEAMPYYHDLIRDTDSLRRPRPVWTEMPPGYSPPIARRESRYRPPTARCEPRSNLPVVSGAGVLFTCLASQGVAENVAANILPRELLLALEQTLLFRHGRPIGPAIARRHRLIT